MHRVHPRAASFALLVTAAIALAACGDSAPNTGAPDAGDGGPTDGSTDAGPPDERFRTVLSSAADLAALTSSVAQGSVKYLARVDGRAVFEPLTENCYFQNMRLFPWHLGFLQSFEGHEGLTFDAYLALVLRPPSRLLWGGAIKAWSGARHPVTTRPGVIAYEVYSDPNTLTADDIVAVDQRLKACIPFASELLVFVAGSNDQKTLLLRERAALLQRGVAGIFPEELIAGVPHVAYSRGEGYGTLQIVPAGEPLGFYGPNDVVIVESAPNDISVVAALITKDPQNALGHVNLRLREKGIPNVAVPAIYDAAWIQALAGSLVHVIVRDDQFELEAARLEDAQRWWDEHRPRVRAPEVDLTVKTLTLFDDMRATDRLAFGVKAANLGEIRHVLGDPHSNAGFGIAFAYYDEYMKANGIDAEVATLVADPRMKTDAPYKAQKLELLRNHIKEGVFTASFMTEIRAAIEAAFGAGTEAKRMKFRSSTNVEDLDQLSGAGLYDSKAGCLADDLDADTTGPSLCLSANEAADLQRQLDAREQEYAAHPERTWLAEIIADLSSDLTKEKPIEKAIKKTWASLFNDRAWDEREYYGIDHRLAYMAIAVNPSFVLERANSVAVSNLLVDSGAPLYRVNSQIGEESVVRPADPTAVAELLTFRREGQPPEPTEIRVEVGSSLLPAGEEVFPREDLVELAHLLFQLHDHFSTEVYPNISPLSLDFEAKLTPEGDVVIKQVRPYVSLDP